MYKIQERREGAGIGRKRKREKTQNMTQGENKETHRTMQDFNAMQQHSGTSLVAQW